MLLVVVFWVVFSEVLSENVTVWLFLVKKQGKRHFLSQKMVKKDTSVFSQNPKDTSVPPKDTSVPHFVRIWKFNLLSSKRTLLSNLMSLLFFKGHFCLTISRQFKIGRQLTVKDPQLVPDFLSFSISAKKQTQTPIN